MTKYFITVEQHGHVNQNINVLFSKILILITKYIYNILSNNLIS